MLLSCASNLCHITLIDMQSNIQLPLQSAKALHSFLEVIKILFKHSFIPINIVCTKQMCAINLITSSVCTTLNHTTCILDIYHWGTEADQLTEFKPPHVYCSTVHIQCTCMYPCILHTCTCTWRIRALYMYQCLLMSNVFVSGSLQNLNIPSSISRSLNYWYTQG